MSAEVSIQGPIDLKVSAFLLRQNVGLDFCQTTLAYVITNCVDKHASHCVPTPDISAGVADYDDKLSLELYFPGRVGRNDDRRFMSDQRAIGPIAYVLFVRYRGLQV